MSWFIFPSKADYDTGIWMLVSLGGDPEGKVMGTETKNKKTKIQKTTKQTNKHGGKQIKGILMGALLLWAANPERVGGT